VGREGVKMNCLITSLLLVSVVAIGYAEICKDNKRTQSCIYWKRYYKFCQRSDAARYCKMTCGLCKTGPTTTSPPIKTTQAPPQPQCGISDIPQSRIINGVDAKPGAWPWIASLQHNNRHFCGGTLLTPTWVLTASHCVGSMTPSRLHYFSVNLGVHDRRASETSVQKNSRLQSYKASKL